MDVSLIESDYELQKGIHSFKIKHIWSLDSFKSNKYLMAGEESKELLLPPEIKNLGSRYDKLNNQVFHF